MIGLQSAMKELGQAGRFHDELACLTLLDDSLDELAGEPAGCQLDIEKIRRLSSGIRVEILRAMPLEYCNCKIPRECTKCNGKRWITAVDALDKSLLPQRDG